MCADMCLEYVEGGINAEILTSKRVTNCKVDCPRSCRDDNPCANCCNCIIGGGIPVCRKTVCTCLLFPPTGQFNNVPNSLPTIAN
jgi:hypothetical protein